MKGSDSAVPAIAGMRPVRRPAPASARRCAEADTTYDCSDAAYSGYGRRPSRGLVPWTAGSSIDRCGKPSRGTEVPAPVCIATCRSPRSATVSGERPGPTGLRHRAGRTGVCPVEKDERHVSGSPRHRCPGGLPPGDPLGVATRPSYRPTPELRRCFRPVARPGFATVPVTYGRRFPRRYLLLLLATAQRNISRWVPHPPDRIGRAWCRSRPRRTVPGSAAAQRFPKRPAGNRLRSV